MILPISKMYSIGLFLAILLVCILWTRYQQRAYNQLQQDNKQLKMHNTHCALSCHILLLFSN